MIRTVLVLIAVMISAAANGADEKIEFPSVSQHASVKQRIGLTDVEVAYSRPNKNKREIFGGLVPFNKLWRTGANEPTRIKFSEAVTVNGKPLPPGDYALFTIPAAKQWLIIFSKDAKVQSAADYDETKDASRVAVAPRVLADPVETFTIGFDDVRTNSANLIFDWDNTRVSIPLTTNTNEQVQQEIDTAIKSGKEQDASFYYNAASFYLEQNKDIAQAQKWIDQAVAKNPTASFMFYKQAQIEAKLGHKAEAIAAAEKSNEILKARPQPDEAALRNNQALIDSLR